MRALNPFVAIQRFSYTSFNRIGVIVSVLLIKSLGTAGNEKKKSLQYVSVREYRLTELHKKQYNCKQKKKKASVDDT